MHLQEVSTHIRPRSYRRLTWFDTFHIPPYIVLPLSVCLSLRPSVCQSNNLPVFLFDLSSVRLSENLTLKLDIGHSFKRYVRRLPHFTCVVLMVRHFLWCLDHLSRSRSNIKVTFSENFET